MGALSKRPHRYYRTFSIPKGKQVRIIHAPKVALKVIQKWFGFHLSRVVKFDEAVFGFIEGRSAVKAAALHCGADWIYSIDIADFFNSIPLHKVTASLVSLGYTQHGAEVIGNLCCYQQRLAQGSPASPVLSNLVFRDADDEFVLIAKRYNVKYTRYADDIVFSGKGPFPMEIKPDVRRVIETREWRIADRKEHLASRPNRLKVHGLLVHGPMPRLTKGYRNRIRAFKYMLLRGGVNSEDVATLEGHISYSSSVDKISNP
jgi:hypothetical protein